MKEITNLEMPLVKENTFGYGQEKDMIGDYNLKQKKERWTANAPI